MVRGRFGREKDPTRPFNRCRNRQRAYFFAAFLLSNPYIFIHM
jgi:hypothetical protein